MCNYTQDSKAKLHWCWKDKAADNKAHGNITPESMSLHSLFEQQHFEPHCNPRGP